MPYTTPLGQVYDSGDFASVMDEALEVADWYGSETRRKAAPAEGSYAGIGVACFVEPSGGWCSQRADLRFHADGTLTEFVGAHSTAMAPDTTLAHSAPDGLHPPPASVRIGEGARERVHFGRWTSRASPEGRRARKGG